MERGAAVKRLLPLALLLALVALPHTATARTLVLVTNATAPLQTLDAIEMRKLFLGLPVQHNGVLLHALLNTSDTKLQDAFLQYIVAMSQSAYDRHVLMLINTRGQPQLPEFTSTTLLLSALAGDPRAVSYAWQEDVSGDPRIRTLRVLWHE
jgi:hypothetical protein